MNFFKKLTLTIILCIYLAVLTKMVLFKYIPLSEIIHHFNFRNDEDFWRSNNYVPFKTINFYLFLADVNLDIRIKNLAGNVFGFIPFGFILPLLVKKFQSLGLVTVTTFALSLSFEVLQLIFEFGSFDVDDLILNTFGGILGYIPIKVVLFLQQIKRNKRTVVN
ncbi:VanZ family protein [Neobacillus dielmonensis]|uniref:VanZ family protein n=1 Tax=Neobacillus dielmonensis TaxID=1347369 RepID=UPI0005A9A28D|nr:VanZ family protein [Neobacillus dielmonensis]